MAWNLACLAARFATGYTRRTGAIVVSRTDVKVHFSRVFHAPAGGRLNDLEGVQLANFAARAWAFLVDFVIVTALAIAVGLLVALGRRGGDSSQPLVIEFDPFDGAWGLLAIVAYFGLATRVGRGRTIGKWLLRIRVVSLAHEQLSWWHSIERALGYAASALEGGFGFLQFFLHPNCQTVHDRIAGTIVVAEPKHRQDEAADTGESVADNAATEPDPPADPVPDSTGDSA